MKVKYLASILFTVGFLPFAFAQNSLVDTSFSVGSGANGAVNGIIVQADGKILFGGEFTAIAGQSNAYLARLESNGNPDPTFISDTDGPVWKLCQQPDGKILVGGGFSRLQGASRYNIGRLATNGLIDPEFDAGTNFINDEGVFGIGLQTDGKVLVSGFNGIDWFAHLSRLRSDGELDDSFTNSNVFDYVVRTFSVRPNGKILVGGGFSLVNESSCAGLAVFDSTGNFDKNASCILPDLSASARYSDVFSMIEFTNGNILVAGILLRTNSTKVLGVLNPSFQWETNFNTDSVIGGDFLPYCTSVLRQSDGKTVLGGDFYEIGGYWRRHLARLDAQGHVDPCFDPGLGLAGFDGARVLAQQSDGRILVGGKFETADLNGPANIVRLVSQTDCDIIRVYFGHDNQKNHFAAGTYPPGGTNYLQVSSNLVDWVDWDITTGSYLYAPVSPDVFAAFFRVKKVK